MWDMSSSRDQGGAKARLRHALEALGLESYRPARIRQVHGNTVVVVERGGPDMLGQADGMVTRDRGIALVTVHADCFPVFLLSPMAVGLVHAGWRGVLAGVVPAGVEAMARVGASVRDMKVVFGPGVGTCCYTFAGPARERFCEVFDRGVVQGDRLDLYRSMVVQLLKAGVPEENIGPRALCTSCNSHLFFSHRKEGECGRFAAIAALL